MKRFHLIGLLAIALVLPQASAQDLLTCSTKQLICGNSCQTASCIRACGQKAKECMDKAIFGGDDSSGNSDSTGGGYIDTTPTPSYQQPTTPSVSRRIEQPYSNTGQACAGVTVAPHQKSSSTQEDAESCDNGWCYDLLYVFHVKNFCNAKMSFRWSFPSSKSPARSLGLAPGESTQVSCAKNASKCDGRIKYTWFTSQW